MIFEELLAQGQTIFICGEGEELRSETLTPLLALGLAHYYFVQPKEGLRRYFEENIDPSVFSFVASLDEIPLKQHPLIVCGFEPYSALNQRLKQVTQPAVIFYRHRLAGVFQSLWAGHPNIQVREQSLTAYIAENTPRPLYKSSEVVDREGEFFTNRGEMLDLYRAFIAKTSRRCCKIIGLKGIGKRAFVRRLKFVLALDDNCFEVRFADKSDDISYLLAQLLKKFSISYEEAELENFSARKTLPVVAKLFEEFDRLKNAKLIFYNVAAVYDARKRRFYDHRIGAFWHQLLERDSYPRNHNRIYFVADENFTFHASEDRDVTYTIQLKPLHPEHVKYILEHEFTTKGQVELAQAVMKYDDGVIHNLLGGHPQIAKLFVEACENYPMDRMIHDPEFRKRFDEEKAAYLMQHIKLTEEQERMLSYLALFQVNFQFDAIRAAHPRPGTHTLVENLRDKFLLEKEDFLDGHAEYYVPAIIQDYARARLRPERAETYHNCIAEYYWDKAEDLKTPPPEALEAYRLALHHFSAAPNAPKRNHLIGQFKGIFLNKAQELSDNGERAQAQELCRTLLAHFPDDQAAQTFYAKILDETTQPTHNRQPTKGGHTMQSTIFISYSQKDMDFVKNLKQRLEAANIGVTIDLEAAKIGDNLQNFIETAVRENQFTVTVISKNSLQSVWVMAESLENFMYEKVEQKKRFLPIYIDKSVFDDEFFLETAGMVNGEIEKLIEKSKKAYELRVGTEPYDTKRKRLETLRNNLGTIFNTLRERLSADFSSPEKIAENFPKLIQVIKTNIGTIAEQPKEHAEQDFVSKSSQVSPDKFTPGERERLEKELKNLKEQYDLYSTKANRLEKSLAIETDSARIFQIEEQLKEPKAKRDEIAEKIKGIELKLGY